MFLDGPLALAGFWTVAAALLAADIGLFLLARRPVSLRPRRLAWLALIIVGVRLSLILFGQPLANALETTLTAILLLAGVTFWFCGRMWLVKSDLESLREEIPMACQRLFLNCEESRPGDFSLTAKGKSWRLRIVNLNPGLQVVVLPAPGGPGKVALLVHWISKQYPGPVPRFHINLKKE